MGKKIYAVLGICLGISSSLATQADLDSESQASRARRIQAHEASPPKQSLFGLDRLTVDEHGAIVGAASNGQCAYLDRFPTELFFMPDNELREMLDNLLEAALS